MISILLRLTPSVCVIGIVAMLLVSCGDMEEVDVYSARGELIGIADGGTALVVHHEEIEGLMGPMVMTLRFWSEEDANAFSEFESQRGDVLKFELVQSDDLYVRNVEQLPEDTELDLTEPGDADQ